MTFRTLTAMCSLPDLTSLTHRLGKRKFHVSRLTLPHFNFADTDSWPTIPIMRLSNWWPVVQAIGSASLDFDAAPFGSVKVQSADGCVDFHEIIGISLVRIKGACVLNYRLLKAVEVARPLAWLWWFVKCGQGKDCVQDQRGILPTLLGVPLL